MKLDQAILKRRSVRKFTDYYVTDQEINQILEAARLAPSWANTQVWEFVVIRDKQQIEKVVQAYLEKNPAYKCSLTASVLLAACAKKGISGTKNNQEATKFNNWFMFDLGLACQNLALKAYQIGLGTVIVSLVDHDQIKKLLVLPDSYEIVSIIPVGKPLIKDKPGPPRKELVDFTHLNTFGQSFV